MRHDYKDKWLLEVGHPFGKPLEEMSVVELLKESMLTDDYICGTVRGSNDHRMAFNYNREIEAILNLKGER